VRPATLLIAGGNYEPAVLSTCLDLPHLNTEFTSKVPIYNIDSGSGSTDGGGRHLLRLGAKYGCLRPP